MCDCNRDGVQDECHVLFDGCKTADVRLRCGVWWWSDLIENHDPCESVDFVYECKKRSHIFCGCVEKCIGSNYVTCRTPGLIFFPGLNFA